MIRTAVTVAVAVTALLLPGAPASAQTRTITDEVGDVDVWSEWSDAPENPYAEAVDIDTVTISANRRTVRVVLDVADVLTVSGDYAQEFSANLAWTRTAHGAAPQGTGLYLAASDRTEWGPECRGDKVVDGELRSIDSRVTCARDAGTDRVTLRIPTSVLPRSARYLRLSVDSWSFVSSEQGGWEISSRDHLISYTPTRIG